MLWVINTGPYKEAVAIVVGSVCGCWNSYVCVSQPTNQIMPVHSIVSSAHVQGKVLKEVNSLPPIPVT